MRALARAGLRHGPARYGAQAGSLTSSPLALAPPEPGDAPVWNAASSAALDFWRSAARDQRLSADFRRIAKANAAAVGEWRKLGALLPS